MQDDAFWYEAAQVVGITNALNVVADTLGEAGAGFTAVDPAAASGETRALFGEIAAFYETAEVPLPFRLLAHDPGYAADVWAAARHAFVDHRLSRRLKEALAFAVSVTSRSRFGTRFHLAEMRRLGVGERGVMEVLGVTQMFSSYTKIADTLQLEPDMGDIAPVDRSPAPGGAPAPAGRRTGGRAQVKGTSRAKISKGDRRVASRASRIAASPSPAPVSRRAAKKPV
jgi:alkylhydroperoxidase/carboxymuconolactone decarboxylase family protein YurZ